MNRLRHLLLATCLLLITPHRLPAPIQEVPEPATPLPEKSKPKPKSTEPESDHISKSARSFEGTWRSTTSSKNEVGSSLNYSYTLVIRNGAAQWTAEATINLAAGTTWSDFPEPYNAVSPIYRKWIAKSTDLKLEGASLTIRWPGATLADWAPKSIPYGVLNTSSQPGGNWVYFLKQNQMISSDGKTSGTWTRAQ